VSDCQITYFLATEKHNGDASLENLFSSYLLVYYVTYTTA